MLVTFLKLCLSISTHVESSFNLVINFRHPNISKSESSLNMPSTNPIFSKYTICGSASYGATTYLIFKRSNSHMISFAICEVTHAAFIYCFPAKSDLPSLAYCCANANASLRDFLLSSFVCALVLNDAPSNTKYGVI